MMLASGLVGAGLACSNAPSTQLILKFAPKGLGALAASIDITFARLGGVVTVTLLANSVFGFAVSVVILLCFGALISALFITKRLRQIA